MTDVFTKKSYYFLEESIQINFVTEIQIVFMKLNFLMIKLLTQKLTKNNYLYEFFKYNGIIILRQKEKIF